MFISKNKAFLAAACFAISVAATGCSESTGKSKEMMDAAFAKQSEVKAFSFDGSATMNIQLPSAGQGKNPLTSALTGLFTQGNLEWKGAAAYDPVRLEADLKSTPKDSSTAMEFPVILKDNKLYLHIPLLNKQDDYFSIDMAELSGLTGQGSSFTPESLKTITKTVADALHLVISNVDPKWFKEADGITLKDGSKAKVHRLEITEKNRQELEKAIRDKLPELGDLLKSTGLLNTEQTELFKKQSSGFTLQAPGSVALAVDDAGFIRQLSADLSYSMNGADGRPGANSMKFQQSYNDINGSPAFTKDVPAKAQPLGDILKLLMPSASKK